MDECPVFSKRNGGRSKTRHRRYPKDGRDAGVRGDFGKMRFQFWGQNLQHIGITDATARAGQHGATGAAADNIKHGHGLGGPRRTQIKGVCHMAAQIWYEDDGDLSVLDGKKVAIIGYGSQGTRMRSTCVTPVSTSSSACVRTRSPWNSPRSRVWKSRAFRKPLPRPTSS